MYKFGLEIVQLLVHFIGFPYCISSMFAPILNGSQFEGMDLVGLMCWLLGSKMVAFISSWSFISL